METAGQGCDFHGSSASIPGTPSCVFVMRHILLTKGLLQAHIEGYKRYLLGNSWNICWGQDTTTCRHIAERDATRRTTKNMGSQTAWPSLPRQEGDCQLWSGRPWTGAPGRTKNRVLERGGRSNRAEVVRSNTFTRSSFRRTT